MRFVFQATIKNVKNIIENRIEKAIQKLARRKTANISKYRDYNIDTKDPFGYVQAREIEDRVSWPNASDKIPFIMYDGKDAITGGWNTDEYCIVKRTAR